MLVLDPAFLIALAALCFDGTWNAVADPKTVTNVLRDRFRWVRGEGLLKGFESSPGKTRYFCSQCGSHIVAARAGKDTILLRMGCLDTPSKGSYLLNGKQYIVVAVSGGNYSGEYIAYSLPASAVRTTMT